MDKLNQCDRILALLKNADPVDGRYVTLLQILNLRIANYRARVSEMRKRGAIIECHTEWIDGIRYSWYRLLKEPSIVE